MSLRGEIPIDANGRLLADLASGRLAVNLGLRRAGTGADTGTTPQGALCLEDGVLPVLQRAKAPLGKVGLGLPPQEASGPATCAIALHERGWTFADVQPRSPAAPPPAASTSRTTARWAARWSSSSARSCSRRAS